MKKNLFEISSEEKERILLMHETSTKNSYLNLITEEGIYNPKTEEIQKKLKSLGFNPGDIDGKYGKNTMCAVAKFQTTNNLSVDGKVGKNTASKLGVEPYFPKDVNISSCQGLLTIGNGKQQDTPKVDDGPKCETIIDGTCKLVKKDSEVKLGKNKEGCAEYVSGQLGSGYLGNAWAAFNVAKKWGVKYNMFTDGTIGWKNLLGSLKKNKVTLNTCGCFIEEGESKDSKCQSGKSLSNLISSFYPNSSAVDINNLKIGDIVGMYYRNSGNKGKAFCERIVNNRGLDVNGNVTDNNPFTFNTHVGFVGAIVNGMPIIYHSVHGTRLATPANKLLSKNGEAMITWVTGGPKTIKNNKDDRKWFNFEPFSKI